MKIFAQKLLVGRTFLANQTVTVEDGQITAIGGGGPADFSVWALTPGLVDLHCHGGQGFDPELNERPLPEFLTIPAVPRRNGCAAHPWGGAAAHHAPGAGGGTNRHAAAGRRQTARRAYFGCSSGRTLFESRTSRCQAIPPRCCRQPSPRTRRWYRGMNPSPQVQPLPGASRRAGTWRSSGGARYPGAGRAHRC